MLNNLAVQNFVRKILKIDGVIVKFLVQQLTINSNKFLEHDLYSPFQPVL